MPRSISSCFCLVFLVLPGCASYRGYDDLVREIPDIPARRAGSPSQKDWNEARIEEVAFALEKGPCTEDLLVSALILRSPRLLAAMNEWEAAVEAVAFAGTPPEPKITYTYGWGHPETRGEGRNTLMIMQMFPFFGKLALREAAASRRAEAAREGFDMTARDLVRDVRVSFHEWAYYHEAIRITEETLAILERILEVARKRYEAGKGTQHAVLKALTEIDGRRNELVTLGAMRDTARARINALLDRAPDAPLAEPGPIDPRELRAALPDLLERALSRRQEILAIGHEALAVEAERDLATRDYFPDLEVGAGWMDMVMRERTSMDLPPTDRHRDQYGATVGIALPIWIGETAARVRQAERRLEATRNNARDLRNQVRYQVVQAWVEVDVAWRLVNLYDETELPNARTSLDVAEAEYMSDQVGFLDFLDAERTWLEKHLARRKAVADLHEARAGLDWAVGSTTLGE